MSPRRTLSPKSASSLLPVWRLTTSSLVFVALCLWRLRAVIDLPRFWARGPSLLKPEVMVYVTKTWRVFLVNSTEKDITLKAGELFGFNVGSFSEKPAGQDLIFSRVAGLALFFGVDGVVGCIEDLLGAAIRGYPGGFLRMLICWCALMAMRRRPCHWQSWCATRRSGMESWKCSAKIST